MNLSLGWQALRSPDRKVPKGQLGHSTELGMQSEACRPAGEDEATLLPTPGLGEFAGNGTVDAVLSSARCPTEACGPPKRWSLEQLNADTSCRWRDPGSRAVASVSDRLLQNDGIITINLCKAASNPTCTPEPYGADPPD